jgi:anti-sigma B factor antagonist
VPKAVEAYESKEILCRSGRLNEFVNSRLMCCAEPPWLPQKSYSDERGRISMALKIASHEVEGVVVLALDGRIVLGEETIALRDKVKALLGEGKKKIVLDLKNVTMIDSSGLGALVTAHSSAKSAGATLRLCNLGTRTNELLQMTRLVTVFEVSNSETDAVSAMSKAASAD